jgi:hypothetical protein
MMSNLINFLSLHSRAGGIKYMADELRVKVKEHENFVLFDYDQINSPRKHPIVDECRGIIVHYDEQEVPTIVCRPFNRFYNLGEYPEAEAVFDWNNCVIKEKVDGSLIKVWWNPVTWRWEIGTRGSMFGDNPITTLTGDTGSITFRQLFLRALGLTEEEFQHQMVPLTIMATHLFELCTLENKVVTSYDGDQVAYLGSRYNFDGEESTYRSSAIEHVSKKIRIPEEYEAKSARKVVELANSLGGLKEGFVITDANGVRLKVKSAAYVAAHHLRGDGVTPKRAVLLALAGEIPEFCGYFPEYLPILTPYAERVKDILFDIEVVYGEHCQIADQKEFAMKVKDYPFSGILFSMRKGVSRDDAVYRLTDSAKVALFGVQR